MPDFAAIRYRDCVPSRSWLRSWLRSWSWSWSWSWLRSRSRAGVRRCGSAGVHRSVPGAWLVPAPGQCSRRFLLSGSLGLLGCFWRLRVCVVWWVGGGSRVWGCCSSGGGGDWFRWVLTGRQGIRGGHLVIRGGFSRVRQSSNSLGCCLVGWKGRGMRFGGFVGGRWGAWPESELKTPADSNFASGLSASAGSMRVDRSQRAAYNVFATRLTRSGEYLLGSRQRRPF